MNISNKKLNRNNVLVEITPTLYRTATPLELKGSFVGSTANIAVQIQHFQDAERLLKDDVFQDDITNLVIDNSTLVDSRSGQYIIEDTPEEFQLGEFDFFLTQKLGSIQEMLGMAILRADAMNRFD